MSISNLFLKKLFPGFLLEADNHRILSPNTIEKIWFLILMHPAILLEVWILLMQENKLGFIYTSGSIDSVQNICSKMDRSANLLS